MREKNRLYRENNPETVKESNRKWIENNRDKVNATQRRYTKRKPEKIKELWESWYENNKERVKFNKIKRVYGITKEQYEHMLEQQSGCCAICSVSAESQRDKTLVVDHCHSSGKIRGLLCHTCNTAIGLFKDNIDSLQRAILYLQRASVLDGAADLC